ncbi:MAG TPA: response regulator [Egibacteraceae bacterium]|nr:response regulator [Egibacteraceae bacterium]
MRDTILVVDNEPDILRFVDVNLRLEGFDVVTAADGEEALERAFELRPALIVLDVMMPKLDGFEVCRRLRADSRTRMIPVIILTAKTTMIDKVVGLTAGADDYVLKPFDPIELVARVRTTLKRSAELLDSSPLTGLPGNHAIGQELARRLADDAAIAAIYADLNEFKAFNDRYGFLKGDEVIVLLADCLREALREHAGDDGFLGHIGGDDFIALCTPAQVPLVCERVIELFDGRIPGLYDPEESARGWIEIEDRRGELRRYRIMTVAMGVATTERRQFSDHRELVQVATEMKNYVKRNRHSSAYAVDVRADD